MGAIISLIVGGMLGRVAVPIVQDFFENETKLGRRIQERKRMQKREDEDYAVKNKIRVSEYEHKKRLEELRLQMDAKRQDVEKQYLMAFTDANQRAFMRDCWPLRNPFDTPMAIEPTYSDNSRQLKSCKLKTVMSSNRMEIVPLRFISALKNDVHPHAATVNSEVSMFLVNNYPANGIHAVVSEIGAWKNDIPVNDASMNYLFMGMKGQPVMVLAPEYTNGGSLVRFKIWSWGLGEELTYPVGFDFGWLDLEALYKRLVANETKNLLKTLHKVKLTIPNEILGKNRDIISLIVKNKDVLTSDDRDRLMSLLGTPIEINSHLRREFYSVAANVYSSITAMYADGYHLMNYGTLPLYPQLLSKMRNIGFMMPFVSKYYLSLVNMALESEVVTNEQAIVIESELAKAIKGLNCNANVYDELIKDIRLLNFNTTGEFHEKTIDIIKDLNNNTNTKRLQK